MTTSKRRKEITLTSDTLHSMLFDIEWSLVDEIESFIILVKKDLVPCMITEKTKKIQALESLLEKRMNILSAQCVIDDEEQK
jgi:hypothetical protein